MKVICKYCGEEFERADKGRGKERTYCTKPECIIKARHETQKKYYLKRRELASKKELKGINFKVRETELKKISKELKSNPDKKRTPFNSEEISDILEISKEYGAVRYKLIQLQKKYQAEVDAVENKDVKTFFHAVEFYKPMEDINGEKAKEILINLQDEQQRRREVKDIKYLVESMLNSIKMKNPNVFIVQAIQGKGDIVETISKLKENKDLYV